MQPSDCLFTPVLKYVLLVSAHRFLKHQEEGSIKCFSPTSAHSDRWQWTRQKRTMKYSCINLSALVMAGRSSSPGTGFDSSWRIFKICLQKRSSKFTVKHTLVAWCRHCLCDKKQAKCNHPQANHSHKYNLANRKQHFKHIKIHLFLL